MTSSENPEYSPSAGGQIEVLAEDRCPLCGGELSQTSGYAADHRIEDVYICTDCSLGELSQIELTSDQIAESVEKQLALARVALDKGLLLSRIGGFITAGAPDGHYEIRRAGEHTYIIDLVDPEAEYTDRLVTGLRNAAEFIQAKHEGQSVVVTDSRWGSIDKVSRPSTGSFRQEKSVPMTDGGVPVAVSPQSDLGQAPSIQQPRSPEKDVAPRTKRALEEDMDVSLYEKGGTYEVHSESGNTYRVDIVATSCPCPDWQQREPEGGCKHLRRVDHEVTNGLVPRPDGQLP
ncbi:hypothetical protein [Halorussus sp. AFM4]|uniref:hypothetical protein n=1 Tax=Halorussus sp. AFM4 TaxID=3421651 RepID=UPI003EBA3335